MPSPGISNGNAIREADKFQPTIVILSGAQRSRRISWEKAEILRLTSFAQNDKLYTFIPLSGEVKTSPYIGILVNIYHCRVGS